MNVTPSQAGRGRHEVQPTDNDERELVRRAKGGENAALGELLRIYQRRVFAFVRRMVQRQDEAVELTQEVFMKAFVAMARFDESRRFLPWLLGIAVNVCRNHRRAGGRREMVVDEMPRGEPLWSSAEPSALERLEEDERAALVQRWLDALAPEDRALLLLRFAEGLSHREIGAAYGRPEVVMRMRVHRAWKRLLAQAEGGGQ